MTLYTDRLAQHIHKVEQMLPELLPATDTLWSTVAHGMHYACEGAGKRLRPALVMEFTYLCGGNPQHALPFACAIEMIHAYSLVHDDMPCMDNSPLRRGKPSVHAAYGENMALLVGDGLLTRAFEVMLNPLYCHIPSERALMCAYTLAHNAGIEGMVGGQTIDIQSEGNTIPMETLIALQQGKTVALLEAACMMGVYIAGGNDEQLNAARLFGKELGHGFQIVDDILDVISEESVLGKPIGGDAHIKKSTYVTLLGLEEAKKMAAIRTENALRALDAFGKEADDLRSLTRALLHRNH